jgi:hypothetical protein
MRLSRLPLHTGKTEKEKIEKKLTLEHLLPRDWEAHWPLVVREQSSDAHDLALKRRTQAIHRAGNLTLLTKELNPSVSNGLGRKIGTRFSNTVL